MIAGSKMVSIQRADSKVLQKLDVENNERPRGSEHRQTRHDPPST